MPNKVKKIPKFRSEQEERAFWESHDSTDYVDWSKAETKTFPQLKPSTRIISLRIPESLFARLKTEANRRDVPYQSYMKVLVDEALKTKTRPS